MMESIEENNGTVKSISNLHSISLELDEKSNVSLPPEYEILSIGSLSNFVNEKLRKISNMIELSPAIMRVILNHYNWNESEAITNICSDKKRVFKELGLVDPDRKGVANARRFVKNLKRLVRDGGSRCKKCAVQVNKRTLYLKCNRNHKYCFMCWNQHVRHKVLFDKESYAMTCPSPNCRLLIDYDDVVQNALLLQVSEEYQRLNLIKFVQNSKFYEWCPNASCRKIIMVKCTKTKEITCCCGYKFCFSCFENWHDPINCEMLQKWLMKIKTTTDDFKICPNCDTIMESLENYNPSKTNCSSCDIFYCTQCSGPNDINQNLYSENGNHLVLTEENTNENYLIHRFRYYLEKYNKHKEVLDAKKELETYIEMELKFISKKVQSLPVVELVRKIVNSIFACRKTLMYTYIFSYYLNNCDAHSKVFVDNQNSLEITVEDACQTLENIYDNDFNDCTLKSLEKQLSYCRKLEKNLHSSVIEGYEKKIWQFE